jgi:diguanylate cyclase (GGDEF)-like protein
LAVIKKKLALVEASSANGRWDTAVVRGALELLLDAIQPPDHCQDYLDELKSLARDPLSAEQLAEFLTQIANVIAETRFYSEKKYQDQVGFMDNLVSGLQLLDKKLQSTEQLSQAGFSAGQKVSNNLERSMTDIEHRIRKTSNLESIKLWLNQRLSVLRIKVDDFRTKGTQSQAAFNGQMQALTGSVKELESETKIIQTKFDEQFDEVLVDPMTEVGSRVAYERKMREMLIDPENVNGILQLWDIDSLAKINRNFSWKAGNRTLKVIASLLKHNLREQDFIARYGSDKFAIILPKTKLKQAEEVAKRLQLAIANAGIHHKGRDVEASVTGGGTVLQSEDSPTLAMVRATEALREAKENHLGNIIHR